MSKEVIASLEAEVAKLAQNLEQSAANHNVIVGALQQTRNILADLVAKEQAQVLEGEVVNAVN